MLVAGSGWSGAKAHSVKDLADWVAPYALSRGYRVVSIPTAPALRGVASVRHAVLRESRSHPAATTCIYGESSGGHVAYLAALDPRLEQVVDCVVLGGAPTDLNQLFRDKGNPFRNFLLGTVGQVARGVVNLIESAFGRPPYPAQLSPATRERPPWQVSYLHEDGDPLVPVNQASALAKAVPGMRFLDVHAQSKSSAGLLDRIHAWVTPAVESQMGNFITQAVEQAR